MALVLALTSALPAAGEPPAIVALVIDTSGSLTKADLERTKRLALGILEGLPAQSEVAVFCFDDQSRLVLPRTSSADGVRRAVEALLIAGRYTALNDALFDASRYLKDVPAARRAIVLVTDGKDENSALNLDDALKVAEETPIPVFAVGVGHVEERVLRRIAKLTAGDYLTGREATGAMVASKVLAIPEPTAPATTMASSATTGAARAPGPGLASSGAVPSATAAVRGRPRWPWIVLGLAAVGAAALAALGLRKQPPPPRCPQCRRELSNPRAACPFCETDPSEGTFVESRLGPIGEHESPTVLARMDLAEEHLEKTVTLREVPVLTITSGPGSGVVFSLNRQSATSLGRAKANDIVLEDVSVSSQHCRVRPEEGAFVLHDLKSTNGTFVNERRVTRHVLAEGDVIKVGETCLQFRSNQKRV